MKIAIPSEGKTLDSLVCKSFGRTSFFILIDSESMDFGVIDNTAVSSQGGAGIKAAQTIVDNGASIVITYSCGQNSADVLKSGNIKILKATGDTIEEIVKKYNNEELKELTNIHAGYHHHGGR